MIPLTTSSSIPFVVRHRDNPAVDAITPTSTPASRPKSTTLCRRTTIPGSAASQISPSRAHRIERRGRRGPGGSGRPSKLTEQWAERYIVAIRAGNFRTTAARLTGQRPSGTIRLRRPHVRGLEKRFVSRVLPLFKRRTNEFGRLFPELYLQGDVYQAIVPPGAR